MNQRRCICHYWFVEGRLEEVSSGMPSERIYHL